MVSRRISELLESLAGEKTVIALQGPRSVGKSTVLRTFAADHGVEVIDLDDPATCDAVRANPSTMAAGETPMCIDEYQHVPEILDAIKARLSRERARPGIAVPTGSTRHDALPRTAQALTGRLHTLTIWPYRRVSSPGNVRTFSIACGTTLGSTVAAIPQSSTTRQDYIQRVTAGGFPLAVTRDQARRDRWFDDYVRASIERDAIELIRVRQRQVVADLLGRVAAQTGQVLNVTKAGDGLGVDRKTVEEHLRLLEDLFLVARLPAWGKTLRARATAKPKLHVVDPGLGARLLRLTPAKMARLDATVLTEFGHLLETFVVAEQRKQVSWLNEPVTTGHWRTYDNDEVDFVIEFDDGGVLGFEVKSGERAVATDLRGLRKLREALGTRFIAGVALNTGIRSYTQEDRIHVLPIDRLWHTVGLRR